MEGVKIHLSEPGCRLATARNILVMVWRNAPTLDQAREFSRLAQMAARKYPAGTALLDIILEGTPKFDEEVRREITRITSDKKICSLGSADVVLLEGFAGVATRAFLSTVRLVSRTPRPTEVFGDLGRASAWLAPKASTHEATWTPREMVALGEELIQPW